jgi:hypothetical protein
MCGFKLSLSSSVTPRYLAVFDNGIDWPYSFSPAGIWYDVGLFVVKSMTTVFSARNLTLISRAYSMATLIAFCASIITSFSLLARVMSAPSSAKALQCSASWFFEVVPAVYSWHSSIRRLGIAILPGASP